MALHRQGLQAEFDTIAARRKSLQQQIELFQGEINQINARQYELRGAFEALVQIEDTLKAHGY